VIIAPFAEVQAYITGIGSGGTNATKQTANSTGSSAAGSNSSGSSPTPKEKFFMDEQSDLNVILLPGLNTYSLSKEFRNQVVANVTSSGLGNVSAKGPHPNTDTDSSANTTFSAKTNAQKQQQ
jgi:hypothetical protein